MHNHLQVDQLQHKKCRLYQRLITIIITITPKFLKNYITIAIKLYKKLKLQLKLMLANVFLIRPW